MLTRPEPYRHLAEGWYLPDRCRGIAVHRTHRAVAGCAIPPADDTPSVKPGEEVSGQGLSCDEGRTGLLERLRIVGFGSTSRRRHGRSGNRERDGLRRSLSRSESKLDLRRPRLCRCIPTHWIGRSRNHNGVRRQSGQNDTHPSPAVAALGAGNLLVGTAVSPAPFIVSSQSTSRSFASPALVGVGSRTGYSLGRSSFWPAVPRWWPAPSPRRSQV